MTKTILDGATSDVLSNYVGVPREVAVDDSNQELRLFDGSTPGGHRIPSRDSNDTRYQARDDELDAYSGFKPTDKGIMVRVNPGQYLFRQLTSTSSITVKFANGVDDNPLIDLAAEIAGTRKFLEDITFAKKAIATEFVGKLTGNVTGGLDARGKTLQVDDESIPPRAITGLNQLVTDLNAALNSLVIPTGMIMAWFGAIANIPKGWALCDGKNGTPNLSDKFVRGATTQAAVNVSGGAATHTHVVTTEFGGVHSHNGDVLDTVLTEQQIPKHKHGNGVTDVVAGDYFNHGTIGANPATSKRSQRENASSVYEGLTTEVGGGQAHDHGLSINDSPAHVHGVDCDPGNNLPPYYALAYVMKLPS